VDELISLVPKVLLEVIRTGAAPGVDYFSGKNKRACDNKFAGSFYWII